MDFIQDLELLNITANWISEHIAAVILIILSAMFIKRYGIVPLEGVIRRTVKTSRFQTEAEHKQREETLLDITRNVFGLLIWLVTAVLLFIQLDINLEPLLAAGGIAGIIIGFGAQNIMKDIFAGIYVVIENQYQVGDVVDLDGDIGQVEEITLRVTTMRDLDGTVHYIPHGTVQRSKNLSKDYARINLDIGIAYGSDLQQVIEVVNRVGKELAEDEEWKQVIIAPPAFMRVENFSESSIDIKIIGETKPLQQWAATGELRKRLKFAFDETGIEIPFPQRVIHQAISKSDKKTDGKTPA